ncbi:MAG: hypothetical protein WA667_14560 [Candidatus Nitrosopolaris sp.]
MERWKREKTREDGKTKQKRNTSRPFLSIPYLSKHPVVYAISYLAIGDGNNPNVIPFIRCSCQDYSRLA